MEHEKETDMARANSTESPQSELDDLSAQLATLKQDVPNLTKSLGELGTASKEAAKNGARRKAGEFRDAGEAQFNAARDQAEQYGQYAADTVRQQPAASMAVAVGVGFVLGMLTSRR